MIDGPSTKTRTSSTTPLRFSLSLIASVLLAILSSSCCLGPFLYALSGQRTPTFVLRLGDYRAWFLSAMGVTLAWAVYHCFFRAAADGTDALKQRRKERIALAMTIVMDLVFLASSPIIGKLFM